MGETWRIRSSTSFPLHKQDAFDDVFGGPPTTRIQARKSCSNPRVFEGFYDDIFGSDQATRSKMKVKVDSRSPSSCWTWVDVYSSNLRPVNIPSQRNGSSTVSEKKQYMPERSDSLPWLRPPSTESHFSQRNGSSTVSEKKQYIHERSDSLPWLRPPSTESHFSQSNLTKNHKSFPFQFSWSDSSPEPISIELNSNSSLKPPVEDIETDSPSSMGSSHCYLDLENKSKFQDKALQEEDEGDTMSSYALKTNCEKWTETGDETVVAINEAIAWAKEKSQSQNTEATGGGGRTGLQTVIPTATKSFAEWQARFLIHEHCNQQGDGYGKAQFHMVDEKLRNWIAEENKQSTAGCL